MGRLTNKVAIITGAAQGIGECTARIFIKEGAKVVIADLNEEAGKKVAADLGANAAYFKLDVSNYQNWVDCVAFTKKTFGKLTTLINNAGISYRKDIAETTIQEWDRTVAINQTGVFYGMQVAIAEMRTNGEKCSIANASSIEGLVAEAAFFAYCGAKGAVTLMTKAAALYCGEQRLKIRVNSVHPGYIITPMAYDDAKQNGQTIDEYNAEFIKKHPIGYLGEPEDIAYGYVYLSSDEANFISGTALSIDGAYTAQ
ncbi:glucose 1-dehydrogenase [Zophobihabitans entericus]|uniref:Glucose 1-dehydrogenase n=1 Tax=Zophobihabitans entericus TaxID=1635327 RepID=A0A6G9I8P7_9GAMM|nr:glucose 1-dehydrogenase [Zophobihabitans entericus]QIQ20586.1 glucose 1-dehydrogenase [Zophobihabitans entericus]